MKNDNEELLKGIAARIDAVLICLEDCNEKDACAMLRRLYKILPAPDLRHIRAAMAEVKK